MNGGPNAKGKELLNKKEKNFANSTPAIKKAKSSASKSNFIQSNNKAAVVDSVGDICIAPTYEILPLVLLVTGFIAPLLYGVISQRLILGTTLAVALYMFLGTLYADEAQFSLEKIQVQEVTKLGAAHNSYPSIYSLD